MAGWVPRWTSGKVECLNRTPATGWTYGHVFTSNNEHAAALAPWLNGLKLERVRGGFGGTRSS